LDGFSIGLLTQKYAELFILAIPFSDNFISA
jgi:hypothetical protein